MNFAFFAQGCLPFHAGSLDERPLGGTETGIIHLAQALKELGHQAAVFSDSDKPPPSEVLYLRYQALPLIGEIDVFVSVREWLPLFSKVDCKKKMFWTGDSYDQPQSVGIGDKRVHQQIDALLAVSDWHADTLCKTSGFPREKAWPMRNGVDLRLFEGSEARARKRLIYSSTPYRGLKLLPQIYQELLKRHADIELHVFSGYGVYAGKTGYPEAALREFEALCQVLKVLPGVTLHGNVTQKELAREFMKSAILAYPNTFEETSCITAMEAQAAGCVVVTSNSAALPETVEDAGILVSGTPGSAKYVNDFVAAVDRLLSDDALRQKLSARGIERAQAGFGWHHVAKRFAHYLRDVHALS